MPPIRKGDGTGLAPKGFAEVRKGDGTVLYSAGGGIPDSGELHARWDATQLTLSDGDSVTTWADETGNGYDLTAGGAPTFKTSIINGNPVVRFDGVDDFLDVSFAALSQPNTIFAVVKYRSLGTTNEVWFDGTANPGRHGLYADEASGDWAMIAGTLLTGTAQSTDVLIWSSLFDGANSITRHNGTQSMSGDAGAESLDGVTVGDQFNQNRPAPVDVGEILVYPNDKSAKFGDVEQYLSDKWGVSI